MKTCRKCGKQKALVSFSKNKSMKDGLQKECKDCKKVEFNNYYKRNRGIHIENVKADKERLNATKISKIDKLLYGKICKDCASTCDLRVSDGYGRIIRLEDIKIGDIDILDYSYHILCAPCRDRRKEDFRQEQKSNKYGGLKSLARIFQLIEVCGDTIVARTTKADECLEWNGCLRAGYGAVKIGGVTYSTHRISYILFRGPIADGLFVCHKCDNRKCINPNHFFVGTNSDNMKDAAAKGRIGKKKAVTPPW